MPHPFLGGCRVVVITGETSHTVRLDQLTDRLIEVRQRAVLVETAGVHDVAGANMSDSAIP